MMQDRNEIIEAMGGDAMVEKMDHEQRAEALEEYLIKQLHARTTGVPPTTAKLNDDIDKRAFRRGVGTLFAVGGSNPFGVRLPGEAATVQRLPPMPEKPTLMDFFKYRFIPASHLAPHVMRSADHARKNGIEEEVVFACLIHDLGQALVKTDHGWWAAQLLESYISEKAAFAIKYHQALRFYPDPSVGYEYPDNYNYIFGSDYEPPAYIRNAYQECRSHKWYMAARQITICDLYGFDPDHHVELESFTDIIHRNFRQPEDGLGFDNSPVAHMWRSIAFPDTPL
jgi:hypothetical protein